MSQAASSASAPAPCRRRWKVCGRNLELVRFLGQGGQATVLLCQDRSSRRLFALKSATGSKPCFQLRREFSIFKLLMDASVPGIVPVHGIHHIQPSSSSSDRTSNHGQSCLLMDYCNGGSLLTQIQSRSPNHFLREREAACVLRSLVRTLIRCHDLGVIHRDIKAENVLVHCKDESWERRQGGRGNGRNWNSESAGKEEGRVTTVGVVDMEKGCEFYLADFGMACRYEPGRRIQDGSMAGTDTYMAPEMVDCNYDERADIWSLGILLHVMLTATFPGHLKDVAEAAEAAYASKEWDVGALRREVREEEWGAEEKYRNLTKGARELLDGMLRKNPERRMSLREVSEHPWLSGRGRGTTTMAILPEKKGRNHHQAGGTHVWVARRRGQPHLLPQQQQQQQQQQKQRKEHPWLPAGGGAPLDNRAHGRNDRVWVMRRDQPHLLPPPPQQQQRSIRHDPSTTFGTSPDLAGIPIIEAEEKNNNNSISKPPSHSPDSAIRIKFGSLNIVQDIPSMPPLVVS